MVEVQENPDVNQESTKKTVVVEEEYIKLVLKIISVVSKRGGFGPDEFKIVGAAYEHLSSLVPDKKGD